MRIRPTLECLHHDPYLENDIENIENIPRYLKMTMFIGTYYNIFIPNELKPRGVVSSVEGDLTGELVGINLEYPKDSGVSSAGHSMDMAGGVIY